MARGRLGRRRGLSRGDLAGGRALGADVRPWEATRSPGPSLLREVRDLTGVVPAVRPRCGARAQREGTSTARRPGSPGGSRRAGASRPRSSRTPGRSRRSTGSPRLSRACGSDARLHSCRLPYGRWGSACGCRWCARAANWSRPGRSRGTGLRCRLGPRRCPPDSPCPELPAVPTAELISRLPPGKARRDGHRKAGTGRGRRRHRRYGLRVPGSPARRIGPEGRAEEKAGGRVLRPALARGHGRGAPGTGSCASGTRGPMGCPGGTLPSGARWTGRAGTGPRRPR